jgi:hypothetical protein
MEKVKKISTCITFLGYKQNTKLEKTKYWKIFCFLFRTWQGPARKGRLHNGKQGGEEERQSGRLCGWKGDG